MESLEYKTLNKCFSTLVSCIEQSPDDVVSNLRPSGILAPKNLSELNNLQTSDSIKARKIMDIVLNQVRNDPSKYNLFVEALENAGPWTSSAVRMLKKSHSSAVCSSGKTIHALNCHSDYNLLFPYSHELCLLFSMHGGPLFSAFLAL